MKQASAAVHVRFAVLRVHWCVPVCTVFEIPCIHAGTLLLTPDKQSNTRSTGQANSNLAYAVVFSYRILPSRIAHSYADDGGMIP